MSDTTMLDMTGYVRLGKQRPTFDAWLKTQGLNGPLRITEIMLTGPREAYVVVPILTKQTKHELTIFVNLTTDPPPGTIAWDEAA